MIARVAATDTPTTQIAATKISSPAGRRRPGGPGTAVPTETASIPGTPAPAPASASADGAVPPAGAGAAGSPEAASAPGTAEALGVALASGDLPARGDGPGGKRGGPGEGGGQSRREPLTYHPLPPRSGGGVQSTNAAGEKAVTGVVPGPLRPPPRGVPAAPPARPPAPPARPPAPPARPPAPPARAAAHARRVRVSVGSRRLAGMRIGAHVDRDDPLAEAAAPNAEVVQFFLTDPQGYKNPQPRADADALRAAKIDVYVHAPYLVNVATPNNRIRIPSRKLLLAHAEAAKAIGAKGLIVHGGHVGRTDDLAVGIENWRKTFVYAEKSGGLPTPVLIENTAGGDNACARRLDALARLWDAIGEFGVG